MGTDALYTAAKVHALMFLTATMERMVPPCGAASLRHQHYISVNNVAVAGIVPNQSLIVFFSDFFPYPLHLIHQIPAMPRVLPKSARGLEENTILFS